MPNKTAIKATVKNTNEQLKNKGRKHHFLEYLKGEINKYSKKMLRFKLTICLPQFKVCMNIDTFRQPSHLIVTKT